MKKTLILSVLAMVAIAASCTKEMTPAQEKSSIQTLSQTFTATREALIDNETKASFEGTSLQWEEGDSIMISDGTATSKFIATKVEEGVATFKLKAGETPLAEGATYKAYYPTYLAPVDGVISVPQQQIPANGPIPDGKKINYAPSIFDDIPMYCESTTTELQFKNLCAVIKIKLSTPGTSDDTAFSQIIAQTANKSLYGSAKIEDGKLVITQEGEGYGRIAVKNTNAKWLSAVSEYYLSLPVGEYEDFQFVPQTNTSYTQAFTLKDTKKLTLERNKLYTLNIKAGDLCYYLPNPARHISEETANCYNVKQNTGLCGFPAVKGNSNEALTGVDHVGILWKSQAALTPGDLSAKIITNATYKDGMIYFTSVNNSGNAVIAAYDKSDVILWSWHIWSTSALVGNETYPNGKVCMDRNIGGLASRPAAQGDLSDGSGKYYNSIQTVGMLYQWGRKDPFTGRCNNTASSTDVSGHGSEGEQTSISTTGAVDIATTIKNPTVFYASSSKVWCTETATWDGDTKSLYDPCPPGYRVWSSDVLGTTLSKDDFTINTKKLGKTSTSPGVTGYDYLTTIAFFPTTGQLNNESGTFGSGMGYFRAWHRNIVSNQTGFITLQHQGSSPNYTMKTASTSSNQPVNSSYGMAVRCEKIVK